MLRRLIAIIQTIDPQQVKDLVAFINDLLSAFGGGSQRSMSSANAEEGQDMKAFLEACKAKGVPDDAANALVTNLPQG